MKRFLTNHKGLILLALLPSSLALGQVQSTKETTFFSNSFSAEVKPLPTILSAMPGIASAGIGAEMSNGGPVAMFANGYLLDSNLPRFAREARDENEVPVMRKMQGYAGDLGMRYYASPYGVDSWYGGAKVGYSYGKGQWDFKGQQVDSSVRALNPGVEGGYLWSWPSQVLVRLGAGVDGNVIQENLVTAEGEETASVIEARNTIEDYAQATVIPRVDLGLGYRF